MQAVPLRGESGGRLGHGAPLESILCMPCHAATFSAGDMTTVISLFCFLAGMASLCIVWFSAGRSIPPESTPDPEAHGTAAGRIGMGFLSKTLYVLKVTALDVLLQRGEPTISRRAAGSSIP